MPSKRSVLADIHDFNLDPSKHYRKTSTSGHLVDRGKGAAVQAAVPVEVVKQPNPVEHKEKEAKIALRHLEVEVAEQAAPLDIQQHPKTEETEKPVVDSTDAAQQPFKKKVDKFAKKKPEGTPIS